MNIKKRTVGLATAALFSIGLLALGGTNVEASDLTNTITIETKDNVKMVGLKELSASIGGTLTIENSKVQSQYDDKIIEFSVGSEYVLVNGVYETFTTKMTKDKAILPQNSDGAIAEDEEVFVPLEFIERVFNFDVENNELIVPEVEKEEEIKENDKSEETASIDVDNKSIEKEASNKLENSAESNETTNSQTTQESTQPVVEKEPVKEVVEQPKVETPKVETPKVEAPKPEAPKPEAPKPETPKPVTPTAPKVTIEKVSSLIKGGGYNIEAYDYGDGIEIVYDVSVGSANQNIPETLAPALSFVKSKLSGAGIAFTVTNGGSFFYIDVPK